MEKRRVGTRFMDREVTEEDQSKPLIQGNGSNTSLEPNISIILNKSYNMSHII